MPHPAPTAIGASWGTRNELGISDVQFRSIDLSLEGYNETQIAKLLTIDRKTLWRWKTHDSRYRQALSDARAIAHGSASDRYSSLLDASIKVLGAMLNSGSENNRFRAAQAILNMAGAFKHNPITNGLPEYGLNLTSPSPILTPPNRTNHEPTEDLQTPAPESQPREYPHIVTD